MKATIATNRCSGLPLLKQLSRNIYKSINDCRFFYKKSMLKKCANNRYHVCPLNTHITTSCVCICVADCDEIKTKYYFKSSLNKKWPKNLFQLYFLNFLFCCSQLLLKQIYKLKSKEKFYCNDYGHNMVSPVYLKVLRSVVASKFILNRTACCCI